MDDRETRRSGYPLTLPDALLRSEAMRLACAARDFQEIFRLVNRRTGSSHAVMAAAIGKMTSSRVSDVIRGVRGIRGKEVIERVADGFGIPGEMLGLPKRQWEGPSPVPTDDPDALAGALLPLVVNGRTVMVPVDGKTLESLGIGDLLGQLESQKIVKSGPPATALTSFGLEEIQGMTASLSDSRRYLDGPAVESLRSQLETAKRDDGTLGAQRALPMVMGLLGVIEQAAREVKPERRRELLSVGAEGAEFAGWLYRDVHQPLMAGYWYDRAMEWAQEANEPAMQGYVLLKKSQMAYDERDAVRMLTLAQAAGQGHWRLPVKVQAEVVQQQARAFAMLGEGTDTVERALGEAHELLTRHESEPDDRGQHLSPHYSRANLTLQTASCYIEAGQPARAAALYEEVLRNDTLSRRDQGYFLARRACSLALAGQPDDAARVGLEAAQLSKATNSVRTERELGRAVTTLKPWATRPGPRELREALRA